MWHAVGGSLRLETTNGPPCPELIRPFGDGPTGLDWEVDHRSCTFLCDHTHYGMGCTIDFLDPSRGQFAYYSNLKCGRTDSDRRSQRRPP
ncbi:hypothetical protein [Streptomyces sp. A1136]|uniref:hypothetical protein n=1 Tax=Streptomyces sp. A1136 TaxID=2563102 RepID=UPI00109EABAD|nr:hypothetical protein [Streptomyces sp. A1136]THA49396.1 hypothetical protein E6R62_27720 [Streptomyces sp. A1136]